MKLKVDFQSRGLLTLFLVVAISCIAFAQRTITGTITDAGNGDPLISATVLVVGTSTGTITDFDGKYTIDVPADATQLEFSYTGYATQTLAITGDVMDVQMSAGSVLDEIVVTGYGTSKKKDLTGSIVKVGEEDFNKGVFTSPDQLLQGKASGVQILNNSGQPGGAATIRIRGNSSIRAGNNPLFVVDGVPLSGGSSKPGTSTSGIGNTASSNPLNYLNPSDIESIQVLKDASAAAIYGSRGANGVIIITTKKGRSGAPTIELNSSIGFSSILKKYDVLTGDEYRQALSDYGISGDFGTSVDVMDEILQTGVINNHSISISGGGEAGSYRASIGYLDQEGIVKENGLTRINANLTGSYKFLESKRLGVDINVITSHTKDNGPAISTNAGFRGSLIGNALQWNPTHALYNADGSPIIIPDFGNFTNPVALLDAYDDETNTVDVLASISPSYKLTDNLTYKFTYSINHGSGTRRAQIASWLNLEGIEGRGLAALNDKKTTTQVLTHTLNYVQDLTPEVSLNAVVGYEYQKFDERETGFSAQDFSVENFDYVNIWQNSSTESRSAFSDIKPISELQSYFARANFNISDKYLITGTIRADGSSKFGDNNRYGIFPAFAVGWNLHNEDFLSSGTFDNLKFRAGWGQTGNSEFDAGASQERYSFGQGTIQLANVANPDLKWETTTNLNVGIDFAILDYKVSGTIEYFNRKSKDLLFQFPTIQPAPAGFYWINLDGEVENSGIELSLNTEILNTGNLRWNFGTNVSFLNNELKSYNGPNIVYGQLFGQGISGATIHRLESGQPLNAFYLRDHLNIGDDGQSVFADNEALAYLGDPNPDVLLGITTGLEVGNFNLTLNFNGALGQDVYNNTKNTVVPIGNLGTRNVDADLVQGRTTQEAVSNAIKSSDRYLENGSYVKLANATFSYNIGEILGSVKNARVYVTGQNLLVFTGYSGFDPEVNTVNDLNGLPSAGIEYIPYPSARTFTFGVNFSF